MPDAKPCDVCGKTPQMQSDTPEGRTKAVWRMACECGRAPIQWSVTPEAAVRLWNWTVGEDKKQA
ncbi:MAG: serine acetyltransferase [Desulfovibrio sp.]|nr:serine acetyltransferase [Desulfovibrio sp.]